MHIPPYFQEILLPHTLMRKPTILEKCLPKLPPSRISANSNLPRFSSIGTIILSSDNPSTSFRTYITAPANFHNSKYFSSLCTTSNAVEAEESVVKVEMTEASEAISPVVSRRSHPAQPGEGFDAPPSLERSGSEHREGAVTSLALLERRGLGSGLRTLPQGRDRWGQYSTE